METGRGVAESVLNNEPYRLIKADLLHRIDRELDELVTALDVIGSLKEALRYSLFPAGKRIRPLLALLVTQDLGGAVSEILRPACALELVHSASLIHDDLPALDNDDFRRGRPTVHKAFGEGLALLAGDYLVPLAFKLLVESSVGPGGQIKLARLLGDAWADVCHGQVRDILPDNIRGDLALIRRLKTGALFRAAFGFGGVGAGTVGAAQERLELLGMEFGEAFQIIDDFKDIVGNLEETGRKESSDARNQKTTSASGGVIHSWDELEAKVEKALQSAENAGSRALTFTRAACREILIWPKGKGSGSGVSQSPG